MEPIEGLPVVEDFMESLASFSVEGVFTPPNAPIACSKGFPDVLGVLAEPANPKAPDPRPNWFDAPVVGDVITPGGAAGVALKGFERPWEEVGPALRFVREE